MTQDLRIWKDVLRGQAFEIEVDGVPVVAYEGETVAAALMAAGIRTTNKTARGQPRGICCGIGLCYGCTMVIDGVPNTRTCQTRARPGMRLETQKGLQRWEVAE
ncbi:MAG: (2Fe-2S)-binding protein [Desulfobacterales bacterium]|jgi:predicted molibdopterin-dependent oxidoreductase YjgC|nr:(2Fe-2S)-binding protein [Desulfobacterales bacterium]